MNYAPRGALVSIPRVWYSDLGLYFDSAIGYPTQGIEMCHNMVSIHA